MQNVRSCSCAAGIRRKERLSRKTKKANYRLNSVLETMGSQTLLNCSVVSPACVVLRRLTSPSHAGRDSGFVVVLAYLTRTSCCESTLQNVRSKGRTSGESGSGV